MALVINTNVSSLTAQRALADSNAELQTAMERLSTGSKINSAADDAAGLAMTQRMTAQVRGLAMAIKNANDGQALTQSVEGALAEVSDMLQRMRELALQAANGTNSSADRTFLQSEVNLLVQEITRVATNTRYNGELILDGTFLNKSMQVGIEEGENIIFSVESVAAESVGAHTLVGNGVGALAAGMDPADLTGDAALQNPSTIADDIEIFGFLGTKETASSVGDTAKETAVKINNLTGETGVRAYAKTYAALSSSSATAKTYSVKINGYQTGNFVISSGDAEAAVDAINQISGSTGVTASSANNKVILFDSDGDDITIENTQTLAGHSDLVVEKLGEDGAITNVIGAAVSLQISGANDASRVTGTLKMVSPNAFSIDQKAVYQKETITTGTVTGYDGLLTVSDGTTTVTKDYASGSPANLDVVLADIKAHASYGDLLFTVDKAANGTDLEFNYKAAGADYQVETITPGTLGSITTVVISDGNSATSDISIANPGSGYASVDALLTAIKANGNYGAQGFTAHKSYDGTKIELIWKTTGEQANAATIAFGGVTNEAISTSAAGQGSPAPSRATYTAVDGSATLGSIAITTNGVNSLGYYKENTNTADLINLTQVNITTMVKAGDSISIVDAALDKVAQMRSDLGAIENRLAYTVSNLMNIAEKTADARSRLDDADFALESARLAKAQVIQQAGTSMLSQANQMTQLVLELLR
ncbi:MAG: flagellin [Candidatus Azotimanducaceae bacterium]